MHDVLSVKCVIVLNSPYIRRMFFERENGIMTILAQYSGVLPEYCLSALNEPKGFLCILFYASKLVVM